MKRNPERSQIIFEWLAKTISLTVITFLGLVAIGVCIYIGYKMR